MAKRKRTTKPPAPPAPRIGYDGKPPKLIDVRGIDEKEREAKTVCRRNVNENPVDQLFSRDLITAEQREAGKRLLRDWELSQISPSRGRDLSLGGGGGGTPSTNLADAKLDAMARLNAALTVVGAEGRAVLTAVIIDWIDPRKAAPRLQRPQRAVVPMLCVALDALVVHYGTGRLRKSA